MLWHSGGKAKIDVGYLHKAVTEAIGDDSRDFLFTDHLAQFVTKGPTLIGTAGNNPPAVSKKFEEFFGDQAVLEEKSTLYLSPTKSEKAAIEKMRASALIDKRDKLGIWAT